MHNSAVLYSSDIKGQTVINPFMTGTQVRFVELDWANEESKSSIGHQQRKARKVGKDSLWQANGTALGFHRVHRAMLFVLL